MFGKKGQAFDAFKLLIAAVVAGAILVILLGMLGGFITPSGDPISVMSQSISKVKGAPGSGSVSAQMVQFKEGDVVSSEAVETKSGVNTGTVKFCGTVDSECTSACPPGYGFDEHDTFFSVDSGGEINAIKDVSGKIRVYNCGSDGKYWIGFKPVS